MSTPDSIRVLCIGDIVGSPGRQALQGLLSDIQKEHAIDCTIANIENVAGGFGVTAKTYAELEWLDIQVYTSGNHIFNKKEIFKEFPHMVKLIRPYNLPPESPGVGIKVIDVLGIKIAVLNLMGRVFMPLSDCPFRAVKTAVPELRKITPIIVVDFHAEATSEKQAMGWALDGLVSCMFGTHTHVMTADEQVLERGTAYISDIGMTGAKIGILGMEKDPIVGRFLTQLPIKFEPSSSQIRMINAIKVEIDTQTGKARSIQRIQKEWTKG